MTYCSVVGRAGPTGTDSCRGTRPRVSPWAIFGCPYETGCREITGGSLVIEGQKTSEDFVAGEVGRPADILAGSSKSGGEIACAQRVGCGREFVWLRV